MNTKKGRPRLENPQNFEVKARLNKETSQTLEKFCEENNMTNMSRLERQLIYF